MANRHFMRYGDKQHPENTVQVKFLVARRAIPPEDQIRREGLFKRACAILAKATSAWIFLLTCAWLPLLVGPVSSFAQAQAKDHVSGPSASGVSHADEQQAAKLLSMAEMYNQNRLDKKAEEILRKLIAEYPATNAAATARKQLGIPQPVAKKEPASGKTAQGDKKPLLPTTRRVSTEPTSENLIRPVFSENLLTEVDDSCVEKSIVVNDDGSQVGFFAVDKQHTLLFVRVNGKDGKRYKYLDNGSLVLNRNGHHFAYSASMADKRFVVYDGQEGPGFDVIGGGSIQFSPDGNRFVYAAQSSDKWFVVDRGTKGPAYDEVGLFCFAPVGSSFAYAARMDEKWLPAVSCG